MVYSAIPDHIPYISVFCDDEGHSERWFISTFYRDAEIEARFNGEPFWAENAGHYQIPGESTLRPITGRASATLDGDVPFERGSDGGANVRRRFSLECGRCKSLGKYRRLLLRAENASPIFGVLASAGVKEISLEALSRRVARA